MFDLFYLLLLDETRERVERRQELDSQLASAGMGASFTRRPAPDRSDRAARAAAWGKTPAQQRAMRSAMNAGGGQANVAGTRGRRSRKG